MFFPEDSVWSAGLKAGSDDSIARIVGYEDEGLRLGRVLDLRWSQETDHGLNAILIGPYSRRRMSNREMQVGHVLPGCRSHRPLPFKMNTLQQVKLNGWQLPGHRFAPNRSKLVSQSGRNSHWPQGEGCLGHVSHNLRQFVLCCPPAGFDELDDEGVLCPLQSIIALDGGCVKHARFHASRFTDSRRHDHEAKG